ncbi:MAG TPA: hypothetical protein PK095_14550 [Myxococcota bacterium]|nr:hypothetical protein [Myxococcota bacterium]
MTSSHIFYIPLILLAGFVLGIVVGRRSAEVQRAEEERRARLKAKRSPPPEAR